MNFIEYHMAHLWHYHASQYTVDKTPTVPNLTASLAPKTGHLFNELLVIIKNSCVTCFQLQKLERNWHYLQRQYSFFSK